MDSRLKAVVDDFAKDSTRENKGVWALYKTREYLIGRAHRNNTTFAKEVEVQMRPYRRLLDGGNMDGMKDKAAQIMQSIYATSVLLGVRDSDGSDIPYTPADGIELFKAAPDFWDFVFRFANQDDNFALELETKN